MHQCANCHSTLVVSKLRCEHCEITLEGRFWLPRMGRLPAAQQQLAEQLVVMAGNLKQLAASLEISYPTLRKRLDELIDTLQALRAEDTQRTGKLLDAVQAGQLKPETAARWIREMKGAL